MHRGKGGRGILWFVVMGEAICDCHLGEEQAMLSFDVERGTLRFSQAGCEVTGWQLAVECGGQLLSSCVSPTHAVTGLAGTLAIIP